jgi:hypothetical protein
LRFKNENNENYIDWTNAFTRNKVSA